jgi:alkylated DNA repair dioxygenase AlkB
VILRGFALEMEQAIIDALRLVVMTSPFRHMTTPGGHTMPAVTNCGAAGWVSSLRGYRYHPRDPLSCAPWPPMPTVFTELATAAAMRWLRWLRAKCAECPLKTQCTTGKERRIKRWEHEAVIDAMHRSDKQTLNP